MCARNRSRNVRYSSAAPRNVLDVYQVPPESVSKGELSPVVVFCHGGAWNSGDKLHYSTMARTFTQNGIVAVIVNYTLHPEGLVGEMLRDLNAALVWTKNNIKRHGGDPLNIFFLGHSAGAQLGALLVLNEVIGQEGPILLKGFIGLAGPYDIRDHYKHEFTRGVENLSPMKPTMGGIPNFHLNSPTHLAQTDLDKTRHVPHLCRFYLLHGSDDTTVPSSSSAKFAKQLRDKGASVVSVEDWPFSRYI